MTPKEFVAKWEIYQAKETAIAQTHFNDICALVGHPDSITYGKPDNFSFEMSTVKTTGDKGRADAFFRGKFIWEYKGPHADLDVAYQQLLLYRDALGNPPLLITSDTRRIIIHTNFTNTVKQVYEIDFNRLLKSDGLDLLKRVFYDPESFKPDQTQEEVTKATADTFVAVTETLQKWGKAQGQAYDPEKLAHFISRLLFCLFAEDLGLLPDSVFTKLVQYEERRFEHFVQSLRSLFMAMRNGGVFGFYAIRNFDGSLFDDDFVPNDPPSDILKALTRACRQNWSSIDPSIFGTLFERVIDESKRSQLGAHYTSKEDILLIIEPVLMQPLRREWREARKEAQKLLKAGQTEAALTTLQHFANRLASVRILDPACGSGNFLYIALRLLLDLQKEVIVFAKREGLDDISLTVSPTQLYGIETNSYAHELAQITVWIGYLQWRFENGFAEVNEPILEPLHNIEHKDAILAYTESGQPIEPTWPETDVVVGNPPFLGGGKIRSELGDEYTKALFQTYRDRLPNFSDLVCYWFEKTRAIIERGQAKRAGLLATNSIRGGANRVVLERIKQTGDIFWAQSDRDWILDGAAVNVSMIGFDNSTETSRELDGHLVARINADLTATLDLTVAKRLKENVGICFMGPSAKAPFDIDATTANAMLNAPLNANGNPNSNVVRPVASAVDLVQKPRRMWTIDFAPMNEEEASQYEMPFEYVKKHVLPIRQTRRDDYRGQWWQYARPRVEMRTALKNKIRFIATPGVAKYRIFVWQSPEVLCNQGTLVFARDDDYFFGVLHSRLHELWALRKGTSLEDRPRYTPTTTFETFPLPWPPAQQPREDQDERVAAVAEAARELVELRQTWLYPTKEELNTEVSLSVLKKRTLTNLYNALTHYRKNIKGKRYNNEQWKKDVDGIISLDKIDDLDRIHIELDQAVLDAYGWPHHLSDDQILERLLTLNLERAAVQPETNATMETEVEPDEDEEANE